MTFKAGELDQRITLRRKSGTADSMGGQTTTWTDIATVWAKVRPMTGREREHSDRLNTQATYVFVIRSRSDVTEKDVAVWNGVTFNIRFVREEPRSRFLMLEAERGVPA